MAGYARAYGGGKAAPATTEIILRKDTATYTVPGNTSVTLSVTYRDGTYSGVITNSGPQSVALSLQATDDPYAVAQEVQVPAAASTNFTLKTNSPVTEE